MKICLFSRAPFIGGAEVACERLALGLMERGQKVTVVVDQKNEVYARYVDKGLDCQVFRLPLREKRYVLSYATHWMRLRRFIKKFRPDLVHSNDLPTHQFVSSVAGSLGLPRICHHRFIYDGDCIDWLNRKGAEKHLFVSEYLMETLCSCSRKLADQPGTLIYDGIPSISEIPYRTRAEMRKKLELDGEFPIVAFAGQMNEIKGVKELLDAWKIVQSRHPSAQLVLLGDDLQNNGAYKNEMLRYSEIHRLNARFVGFQKNVRDWLLASNVSVVPSREEPLGLVVIESMSVGVPVVACNTGGIRETVVDGKTGLLVPVNNYHELSGAISQLLDRPDWAGKLGAAGRSRYEELFSLEHHVESTEQIYQQLLASKII